MTLVDVQVKQAGYDSEEATISDLSFSVKRGELIGLIGPNGAGKSTTIKTILGLMTHVEGEVSFGSEVRYSYLPERPIFYDELTLWEHLDFIAGIEGLDDVMFRKEAESWLAKFKLSDVAHELPSTYSKGMQQKAMLIMSLITNPDLYIIDEPFIGLDPLAMRLFLTTIEEKRKAGAGILMSTHVLDTAEKVCDRFLLIHDGKLAAEGTLNDIRNTCQLPEGSLFDCFHMIAEGDLR